MIKVQGESYGAVSHAICTQSGYTGYKQDVAHKATAHALDWWLAKDLPQGFTPPNLMMSKRDQRRCCKRYVKEMTRELKPGFFDDPVGFIIWPAILNGIIGVVIQLVLDWLNSNNSLDWRKAHQS